MTEARPEDQDIVIIGATGDLARRKLFPALYRLFERREELPEGRIIGFARSKLGDDAFCQLARTAVQSSGQPVNEQTWAKFAQRLTYVSGEEGGYAEIAHRCQQTSRLIYLATPPSTYPTLVEELDRQNLVKGTRLLIEKPFGRDLASARALEDTLDLFFDEAQIFRIDHYLGKETVQNILVFRFANSIFERVWNRDAIDHIQITLAESIGIEGRSSFYEETGAIRDVVQNHVFQVLSLLTMEPPASFDAESLREERSKLFYAMKPIDPAHVVRAQYARGTIDGKEVPGYREEEGVDEASTTETFASMKVAIDNWRWAGVPFYLRSGKRLPRRAVEIEVSFRDAPIRFFASAGLAELPPNHLSLGIEPDESITFVFLAKVPGSEIRVQPARMEFAYGETFIGTTAQAYERLLWDAMAGDHTLFARADSVERSWEVLQPVLDAELPLHFYQAGTWGPPEADAMIAPRRWHLR
jgi:glucose-6-phosphate 1-dehydrogenase